LTHFKNNNKKVSKNGVVISYTQPTTLTVVNKLSAVDTKSWNYISQQAPEEEFLNFLVTQNIFSSKVPPSFFKGFLTVLTLI